MTRIKNRYISKEVKIQLSNQSRGRCCLCRMLIIPGEKRVKKIYKILEKHHIVKFAEGGPNSLENLMVVCPNCHSLIHNEPLKYTPELLLEFKNHWINMKEVVPNILYYNPNIDEIYNDIRMPFIIETLNLRYNIIVPPHLKVKELLEFINSKIMSPFGKYDNNNFWQYPDRVGLAFYSKPFKIIDPEMRINNIQLHPLDALTVIFHMPVQFIVGEKYKLSAIPNYPNPGESYKVIFKANFVREVIPINVTVIGTDGYKKNQSGLTNELGEFSINVPGAKEGVVDKIIAIFKNKEMNISLVFTRYSNTE